MNIKIIPGTARGAVTVPSSKSYAHRMTLAAALSAGETHMGNITFCDDIDATMDCVRALGTGCEAGESSINIKGTAGRFNTEATLNCRESGSTLRFMIPVVLINKGTYHFTGTKRLFERGVEVYEEALSPTGISFKKTDDGLIISGELKSGEYILPGNVSSQYISGLLFALPVLEGDSLIKVLPPVESRRYIDITIEVLRTFGVNVTEDHPNEFSIKGSQTYKALNCQAEGDWSNAAFLYGLQMVGGDFEIKGLNPDSIQGDKVFPELMKALENPEKPIDISACPDLGPILFAAAAFKNGGTFTGTRRLRIKESDRAAAMAEELSKFGIAVDVHEDSVVVHPGTLKKPEKILSGHNDHRIVMSLAVLCTVTGGIIEGAEAVNKSFPGFFSVLESLGVEVIYDI
ncbi:MAG: 3-phosphoshikimate 1-carboxyvinyltransferase [Parasporobacterium sp.]|nr:3-phosphoshikimate 1-carboxyvinyltransferase [Parasporobacterium sp.]